MVTRGRPAYALQAIRCFHAQSYPNRELVIVESGTTALQSLVAVNPRIRYSSTEHHESIGMLRNRACELARGEILVLWDDDDWHGPHRLSRQIAAIACNLADMTALRNVLVFDLHRWKFWQCGASLHRRLWLLDAQGGTLAFKRTTWANAGGYPDTSVADDARFALEAVTRGARLKLVDGGSVFLYVRHGANTFGLCPGQPAGQRGWFRAPEPRLGRYDRAFYLRMQAAACLEPGHTQV